MKAHELTGKSQNCDVREAEHKDPVRWDHRGAAVPVTVGHASQPGLLTSTVLGLPATPTGSDASCLVAAFDIYGVCCFTARPKSVFVPLPELQRVMPAVCDGWGRVGDLFFITFRSDGHLSSPLVCVNVNLH